MTLATAPGKIILFGEHAVVYGQPAIAVPVSQLRATAVVASGQEAGIRLVAPDLDQNMMLTETSDDDPIAAVIAQVQSAAGLKELPDLVITVTSDIPVASGLGSGAAITASVIRALAHFLELSALVTDEWVSNLTYEIEKIHHGTPSGIDNTVVAYERPVYFVRQQPHNRIDTFVPAADFRFLVADTGIGSRTKVVVGDVRRQWEAWPERFNALFTACGQIAAAARRAIEAGERQTLGRLMNENHLILQEMTVSSPALDNLVSAALDAGALGAKLSGAGRGGNMIALVTAETETAVQQALLNAGAKTVFLNPLSA